MIIIFYMELQKLTHSSESEDDSREGEKWTNEHEEYLRGLIIEIDKKIQIQYKKFLKYKSLYYGLTIPNIIIPLGLASFNPLFLNIAYVNIVGSTCTSILAGVLGFANLSQRMDKHHDFKDRYEQLKNDIDVLLIKHKKYREKADVAIEKIKSRYNNINSLAPD